MTEPMTTFDPKPPATVFYSWQSDLPNNTNRTFIEKCLKKAIKELRREDELEVDVCIDRDTQDVSGTPHIPQTILDKIDAADLFVGDVTIVTKYKQGDGTDKASPNPNVLIELGYAVKCLGWEQVICVANTHFGNLKELPFDLDKRRIVHYQMAGPDGKATSEDSLVVQLKDKISKAIVIAMPRRGPDVEIFFADPETKQKLGLEITMSPQVTDGIDRESLPDYEVTRGVKVAGAWIDHGFDSVLGGQVNRDYHRECLDVYVLVTGSQPICVGIKNNGKVLLDGVKLEINRRDLTAIKLQPWNALVEPKKRLQPGERITYASLRDHQGAVSINERVLEIEFGKVQKGKTIFSDSFWIGATESRVTALVGEVFSDQFSPKTIELKVTSNISVKHMTNDELLDHFEKMERRRESDDENYDDEDEDISEGFIDGQ